MDAFTLSRDHDPMGAAILDYQLSGKAEKLRVLSSMFEEDEIPVVHLFRTEKDMPAIERKALSMARGRILDVGAGAGCHTLALLDKGLNVKAIDVSPLSCLAMKMRGVVNSECINLFNKSLQGSYDTILLLMNGTGIAGKINNLPALFLRLRELLAPGGQVLIDSSDLKYIYQNDDGSFDIDLNGAYYGEVDYRMVYKEVEGLSFDWLYVDFPLLRTIAATCSMDAQLVMEGGHYDYLARLTDCCSK